MDAQAEAVQGINDVRQVVHDTVHSGCEAREAMTQGTPAADASAASSVLAVKGEAVIDKWSKGAEVFKDAAAATGNYMKDTAVATGHLAKEAIFGVKPEESPMSRPEAAAAGQSMYCDDVRCHNLKPCAQHHSRTAEAMQGIRDATKVVYDNLHTGCDARDAMTQGVPTTDASAASAVLAGKGEAVMGKWADSAEKLKDAAAATGNYVKDTAVATGHLVKEMAAGGARRVDEVAHRAGTHIQDAAHTTGAHIKDAAHTTGAHIKEAAHTAEVKVKDAASTAGEKLKEALPRSKDATCECTADSCKCDASCKCMKATCTCTCSTAAATTFSSNLPTSPLHTPTATVSH